MRSQDHVEARLDLASDLIEECDRLIESLDDDIACEAESRDDDIARLEEEIAERRREAAEAIAAIEARKARLVAKRKRIDRLDDQLRALVQE